MATTDNGVGSPTESQRSRCPRALPARAANSRSRVRFGWCIGILSLLGCESNSVIAKWSCPTKTDSRLLGNAGTAGTAGSVSVAGVTGIAGSVQAVEPIEIPWSTGFEDAFCDYSKRCYGSPRIVSEPVHSGLYAAAFTVGGVGANQARCIVDGALPTAAYYGAWYYVPAPSADNPSWNLFHFWTENGSADGRILDVTLVNPASGDPHLIVYNFELAVLPDQSRKPKVPFDSWFHIEMYLKRAVDDTGELILYQDGTIIFQATKVKTDNSSGRGVWHVGSWVADDTPGASTLYVDDITIRATR